MKREVKDIPRSQEFDPETIATALRSTNRISLLLIRREWSSQPAAELRDAAKASGVPIWEGSDGDMRRMGPSGKALVNVIGLVGASPGPSLPELMQRGGAVWLMHRAGYPSNVGFTIRTSEVSGADGLVVDAPTFNREDRSRVSHVSMGADRVMPVCWESTDKALSAATQAGKRIIAIEDVGARPFHEVDLTGPVLLIVGNEREGIHPSILDKCDATARIPMHGFVPSYSLQAAVSMIAGERLRQLAARPNEK